nr:immunoglobulin heavy chain junction region [Macaca mulatta]MPN78179.1 immunoglobulin heavy chain junction region [Macaca mulatta]
CARDRGSWNEGGYFDYW